MRTLDKFLSTISTSKSRVTSALMRARQADGEFTTLQEYRKAIDELITRVSGAPSNTFFSIRRAWANQRTSSVAHNDMTTRVRSDLEVLFVEMSNLLRAVEAHEDIFLNQAVDELHYSLDRIQEQVDIYEFLFSNEDGFSAAEWNTFSRGVRSYSRSGEFANELYSDFRTGQLLQRDMVHDSVNGSLILPAKSTSVELFRSVNVRDWIQLVDGAAFKIDGESVKGYQYSGNVWGMRSLNYPLLKDQDAPLTFTSDDVTDGVSPASWYFDKEVFGLLPAAPGEYLVLYDADAVTALKAIVHGGNIGEIFFWNPAQTTECLVDAVIKQQADSDLACVADAIILNPGEVFAVVDAIITDTTVTADAIILPQTNPVTFGTMSYWYISTARDYHKEDLRGDSATSKVSNMIDNTQNSYWFNLLLKDKEVAGGVRSSLKFNFEGPRKVNYVEIWPVTKYPFLIDSLSYVTRQGAEVCLIDSFAKRVAGPVRFYFDPIVATSIILDIRQPSYEIHLYDLNAEKDPIRLLEGSLEQDLFDETIRETTTNTQMIELLNLTPEREARQRTVYEYVYGIDNVTAGMLELEDVGVYVSQSSTPASISLIGLEVDTDKPVGAAISFEYEMVKKDYDIDGALIGSIRFPMLDVGDILVAGERLIIAESDNRRTSKTRMRAHGMVSDSGAVEARATFCSLKVYQDGVEIARPGRWDIMNNLAADDDDRFTAIELSIDPNDDIQSNAIYTVSYRPLHTIVAHRRDMYLDSAKTLRLRKDNIIEAKSTRGEVRIDHSRIYLTMTQRINSGARRDQVGQIKEYKISLGEKLDNRFSSL